jgi:hypothetical protein
MFFEMRLALLLALAFATAKGQGFELPSYYVGLGGAWDYYGHTGAQASTDLAIRINDSQLYSFSSIDLPRRTSAQLPNMRTGIAWVLGTRGALSLVSFASGGVATGRDSILGAVGAGTILLYDIGGKLTRGKSHLYLSVGERILSITSVSVTPVLTIGIGVGL